MMKRQVVFGALSLLVPFLVQADIVPQIGADIQYRYMSAKKGFGDNLVKEQYPQGSVYGGLKLNDWFGLELGYQTSTQVTRKQTLSGSAANAYSTILDLEPDSWSFNTRSSIQGVYGSLVGFLPISEEYRLTLLASAGFARLKAKTTSRLTDVGTGQDLGNIAFSSTKWIPKVNVGIQHMIQDDIGVRALVGWEQTSKFSHMPATLTSGNANNYRLSLKDSTTLGLGMFYNF